MLWEFWRSVCLLQFRWLFATCGRHSYCLSTNATFCSFNIFYHCLSAKIAMCLVRLTVRCHVNKHYTDIAVIFFFLFTCEQHSSDSSLEVIISQILLSVIDSFVCLWISFSLGGCFADCEKRGIFSAHWFLVSHEFSYVLCSEQKLLNKDCCRDISSLKMHMHRG